MTSVLQMALRQAGSRQRGKEQQVADKTRFSEMRGSMVFDQGIGSNKDLVINSPLLRVEGAGRLDLPNQRLDYKATVALVKSCQGQGGSECPDIG